MNGDASPIPQEYLANSMTIHIVPSFLAMEAEYFNARSETLAFMDKTIKEIDDQFSLQIEKPKRPDADPPWAVRKNFLEPMIMGDYVDQVRQFRPEVKQKLKNG